MNFVEGDLDLGATLTLTYESDTMPRPPNSSLHDALAALPQPLPRTEAAIYRRGLARFVKFAGPGPWTYAQACAFYAQLRRDRDPDTHKIMAGLRLASGDAPWAQVHVAPGRGANATQALTPADLTALLDTCAARTPRDLRDFALLVLAVETGLRRVDLARAAWADVQSRPYPHLDLDGLRAPLTATAAAALKPWRAWLAAQHMKHGAILRQISPRGVGNGLTPAALYLIVSDRARTAGLGDVVPGTLTYTFTRWRLATGIDPQIVHPTKHTALSLNALQPLLTATPAWLADYVTTWTSNPSSET